MTDIKRTNRQYYTVYTASDLHYWVVLEINIALDCVGVPILLYIQYRSGIVLFKYAVKTLQPSETEFLHSLQKYNTQILKNV